MYTLPEVLNLCLQMFANPAVEFELLKNAKPRPEVGATFSWAPVLVDGHSCAFNFSVNEEGRIDFLEFLGEEDPDNEIGHPSLKWVDVKEAARSWSESQRGWKVKLRNEGKNDWKIFFKDDRPYAPMMMAFGPSFPPGPWTDATRAISVFVAPFEREAL